MLILILYLIQRVAGYDAFPRSSATLEVQDTLFPVLRFCRKGIHHTSRVDQSGTGVHRNRDP